MENSGKNAYQNGMYKSFLVKTIEGKTTYTCIWCPKINLYEKEHADLHIDLEKH